MVSKRSAVNGIEVLFYEDCWKSAFESVNQRLSRSSIFQPVRNLTCFSVSYKG